MLRPVAHVAAGSRRVSGWSRLPTCRHQTVPLPATALPHSMQVTGGNAHNQDVDLEFKLAFIVLGGGDLCKARTVAQQTLGKLCLGCWCRLLEACEQALTDIHAHRLVVIGHKE